MQSPLTAAQQRIFNWLEDYIAQYGVSPTYREIMRGLGYRSPSTVQAHIEGISEKGLISHIAGKSRSIRVLRSSLSIPLLGAISAHSLVETFPDQDVEYLNLACLPKLARLSKHELSQHFALRVKGDSMIGALIDDGDVVILRRESNSRAVRNGAIVAARVNGATTLKHFYRNGNLVTLQPANSKYEPTYVDTGSEEVDIQGIYIGVLRGVV
jgi:repressor LexA